MQYLNSIIFATIVYINYFKGVLLDFFQLRNQQIVMKLCDASSFVVGGDDNRYKHYIIFFIYTLQFESDFSIPHYVQMTADVYGY